jgi:hypothetical protein
MNEPPDTFDSGTPSEAALRDRAVDLSYDVLGREDRRAVTRFAEEFRHFWQRGYSAGSTRTARRLSAYR